MDGRKAFVLRIGRAQAAGQRRLALGRRIAHVAAGAGEVLSVERRVVLGLPLVAPDHRVAQVVPVAAHAAEARRGMDVRVELVLGSAHRRRGVAAEAAVIGRFVNDVEKRPVLAVEEAPVVLNIRRHRPLRVVGVQAVVDVPGAGETGGHAADLADLGGGRGRPAEILAEDLFGPLARVLGV